MNAVLTVTDRTQLSQALALGESLRLHNPDYVFILGWVDPWAVPTLPDWIELIDVKSVISSETWASMQQIYTDFEITVSCRPFFARHILNMARDYERIIFMAPSVYIYDSLAPILSDDTLMQLTPHRLSPLPIGTSLDDKRILNIGMFHSNSWVLSTVPASMTLLDWWCARTQDRAYFDLCNGMCLDQLWLNYLPIYHDRVDIIRQRGWHYGLHVIADLPIQYLDEKYSVEGKALLTVDFAGLESYHPVWSDHAVLATKAPHFQQLRRAYRASLPKIAVPPSDSVARYGLLTKIKSGRSLRKKAVGRLSALIHRIDTYDLTH